MRSTHAFLVLTLAASAGLTACTGMRSHGGPEESAARRLVGAWDANFTLVRTDGGTAPGEVRGTIALVRRHYGNVWSPQVGTPDEYGVYDVDFRPFGFDSRDGESMPTAVATISTDSSRGQPVDHIRIVLHPGTARVAVVLDGILSQASVLSRDAITGDWQTESRSVSGAGHFTLTRHEP